MYQLTLVLPTGTQRLGLTLLSRVPIKSNLLWIPYSFSSWKRKQMKIWIQDTSWGYFEVDKILLSFSFHVYNCICLNRFWYTYLSFTLYLWLINQCTLHKSLVCTNTLSAFCTNHVIKKLVLFKKRKKLFFALTLTAFIIIIHSLDLLNIHKLRYNLLPSNLMLKPIIWFFLRPTLWQTRISISVIFQSFVCLWHYLNIWIFVVTYVINTHPSNANQTKKYNFLQ